MRQMSSGCCGTGWMFSFLNFEKNLRINRCTVDVLEFDFEKKSGDASDYSECLALPHRGGPNDVFHGQEQMEHLGLDPQIHSLHKRAWRIWWDFSGISGEVSYTKISPTRPKRL